MPSAAQLRVQNFGIAEGLPQSQVFSLAEDARGYLWVGTLGGGLSRFDGQTFETFTTSDGLINNFIRDLFIDSDERLWIATNKGISMFDGVDFHNLDVTEHEGTYVNNVFCNGNEIMYLMRDGQMGQLRYDSALHHRSTGAIDNFKTSVKSASGNLFIVHNTMGHMRVTRFGRDSSITADLPKELTAVHSIFMKGDEEVLSTNGGMFSFKDSQMKLVDGFPFPVFSYDPDRAFYIGMNKARIALIGPQSNILKELDPVNYLVLTSHVDREGTLWLGTDQGLFKVYAYEFENPLTDENRLDAVHTVAMHHKRLWIGTTYQGIKIYTGDRLVEQHNFGSKGKNYVSTIREDRKGRLWIGTLGGVATYESGKFNWQHPELIRNVVSIDFNKDNHALIGGAGAGLWQLRGNEILTIPEFQFTGVWCIRYNESKDFFALGTTTGLHVFDKGDVRNIEVEGLNAAEVSSMDWLDPETLVMGTLGDGIFIYSFESHEVFRIDHSKGLISNTLFFVRRNNDQIWVGTEKGIDVIAYNKVLKKVSAIEHFNDEHGLFGLETNLDAVLQKDGQLLFGLVKGLYRYHARGSSHVENSLHLKSVNLFYKPRKDLTMTGIKALGEGRSFSFNHEENHLTFLFNKVDKRYPEKYFYTYKLTDFDQIWSKPSVLKSVTYSNLSPGNYDLEVRATDREGAFVLDRAYFHFRIQPAYYQTAGFKVLVLMAALLAVASATYWVYRRRIQRSMELQQAKDNEKARLRREIARDFHDELGNQVARMINYVSLLRITEKLEKDIYRTLNGYSQAILNGTKDFVWALDPSNDDLESLVIQLRDFGERMFLEKEIQFGFYGELRRIRMPMGYGRQINLIFKEAMTNAFRHSSAGSVELRLQTGPGNTFTLELRDDGSGIAPGIIEGSERGIDNMRSRALKMGSKLEIVSGPAGTSVKLTTVVPECFE